MSDKVKTTSVIIELDDTQVLNMSVDEARSLYEELGRLFGEQKYYQLHSPGVNYDSGEVQYCSDQPFAWCTVSTKEPEVSDE